jgi:hypothetical protein
MRVLGIEIRLKVPKMHEIPMSDCDKSINNHENHSLD